jgi:lysophospholipase L1-like esterase
MSATTLVTLAVAEVALRLVFENQYRAQSQDFLVDLRREPANRNYKIDRSAIDSQDPFVRFRTDARSYILPSFQFRDPAVTVTFLGGSTTQNAAVKEELRFHHLVSRALAERGLKVNTLNCSRGGNTAHDSINLLVNHVVLDSPDIVVVMHAANDAGVLSQTGGYGVRSGREFSFADTVQTFGQFLSARSYLVALLRDVVARAAIEPKRFDNDAERWRNDPVAADQIPYDQYERRLRALVRVSRAFDIHPVLMTEPLAGMKNELTPGWANEGSQDRMNTIIRKVAKEEGATLIDLAAHFASLPDWDKEGKLFYDGMHVTDEGSQACAPFIADQLEQLIRNQLHVSASTATRFPG